MYAYTILNNYFLIYNRISLRGNAARGNSRVKLSADKTKLSILYTQFYVHLGDRVTNEKNFTAEGIGGKVEVGDTEGGKRGKE